MKFFTYTLSTIALSLLMAVITNPEAAMACSKIVGTS
jgi:hypothetical protein